MSEQSTVSFTLSEQVVTLGLNRPDSLNAFNADMRAELLEAIKQAETDNSARVIVLRGAGRAFCAGADLSEQHPPEQTVEQRINEQYKPILLSLYNSSKPVLAVVDGAAAGIGAALALCSDLIVMTDRAYFYQAFANVGLIPDGGMSWHLLHQLGPKRAFEVLIRSEKLPAEICLELGLVNTVVAPGELEETIQRYVQQLLSVAPLSLRYTKQALHHCGSLTLADAISLEASLQMHTSTSRDHQEGRAAFREKRSPRWHGR